MKREKIGKIVIGSCAFAAVCFGIAGYIHFYRGRMALGWLFATLAVTQLALALANHFISKKNK